MTTAHIHPAGPLDLTGWDRTDSDAWRTDQRVTVLPQAR